MSRREKRVKAHPIVSKKQVRVGTSESDEENNNRRRPVWRFSIVDPDGPFEKPCSHEEMVEILNRLAEHESMTWAEILANKWRNHFVNVKNICPEAKKRLAIIKQDDAEWLFRFRFNGENRLWGLRDGYHFRILWWDPDHLVCPSPKK